MSAREMKDAPVAVERGEGEDQNPTKGTIMSNATTAPSVHPDVAAIFADVDDLPENHYVFLTEGEPFYFEPRAEWTRPFSDFRAGVTLEAVREHIKYRRGHRFGEWRDTTGRKLPIPERDKEWHDTEESGMPRHIWQTPNAVWRSPGGFLFISHGVWYPIEVTELNGEIACRFISSDESIRRLRAEMEAEREAILRQYPEIKTITPEWATSVDVDPADKDIPDDDGLVVYRGEVGDVSITRVATLIEGRWVLEQPATISTFDTSDITPEQARQLAADLLRAADVLEAAEKYEAVNT